MPLLWMVNARPYPKFLKYYLIVKIMPAAINIRPTNPPITIPAISPPVKPENNNY